MKETKAKRLYDAQRGCKRLTDYMEIEVPTDTTPQARQKCSAVSPGRRE